MHSAFNLLLVRSYQVEITQQRERNRVSIFKNIFKLQKEFEIHLNFRIF